MGQAQLVLNTALAHLENLKTKRRGSLLQVGGGLGSYLESYTVVDLLPTGPLDPDPEFDWHAALYRAPRKIATEQY